MTFPYSPYALERLREAISTDRLSTYQVQAQGNTVEAMRLYAHNLALSEALYGALQGVEVTVRNALHLRLAAGYGENWYDNAACELQHTQRGKIQDARDGLLSEAKPLTPGRVVAELTFGFWTGILGRKYEDLWRRHLRAAFPHAPAGFVRRHAHAALDRIRKLRNRVMHHEPILRPSLIEDHQMILDVIGWTCPETRSWVAHHSRFNEVWGRLDIWK